MPSTNKLDNLKFQVFNDDFSAAKGPNKLFLYVIRGDLLFAAKILFQRRILPSQNVLLETDFISCQKKL